MYYRNTFLLQYFRQWSTPREPDKNNVHIFQLKQRAATPMEAVGPTRVADKHTEYMLCAFANISKMVWDTMMRFVL